MAYKNPEDRPYKKEYQQQVARGELATVWKDNVLDVLWIKQV